MAVVVTGPPDTPSNIASNVIAGGDLDASTTYYYRILAQNEDDILFLAKNQKRSDLSAEESFLTTADNKQAEITWDAVDGATYYFIILTKVSGDYVGTCRVIPRGNEKATCTTNAYTIDANATGSSGYPWVMLDADDFPLPFSLSREKGRIQIDFDSSDDYTLQDIYDQIVNDGYGDYAYYDGVNFGLLGDLHFASRNGVTSTLTVEGKNIYLVGILDNHKDSGTTVTLGEYYSNSYRYPTNLTMLYRSYGPYWDVNTVFNGGYVTSGYLNHTAGGRLVGDVRPSLHTFIANGVIFGKMGFGTTANKSGHDMTIEYVIITGQPFTTWDMSFAGYQPYCLYGGTAQYLGTHYRLKQLKVGTYDFRCGDTNTEAADGTLYDASFPLRADNRPVIYWREYLRTYWPNYSFYYSLSLKVQDVDGVAISGATVSIKDINASEVESKTSNTDGFVFEEDITVTSATTTTITDNSKSWDTDEHGGKEIYISSGDNTGMTLVVQSNTSDTLTVKTMKTACSADDRLGLKIYLLGATVTHKEGSGQGAGLTRTTWTEKSPHTVTVTKADYASKTIKYTMDRKREEVLLLSPEGSTQIYDSTLQGNITIY